MGGFNTVVVAPRTTQIIADGDLDMKGYRIKNLGIPKNAKDAVILSLLLALTG